ncbi:MULTISPECIES: hypothetical protein [unclassified Bifidobacterium]|uniref:hypothetical protein n=1 Tax=unclassified Bifidobacterium TaxID=2608897 RepID=UPI0023F638F5|nr:MULTISPECIES: hypothetical protein [unclassified Bifidobacterium]WEV65747.1 hypothetical protein OZX71_08395 [Bifidobacterium sp. ESL0764]WEV75466.1 hypothetical protein OZX75_07555 [Bifidobacterium sp. ESL0800]
MRRSNRFVARPAHKKSRAMIVVSRIKGIVYKVAIFVLVAVAVFAILKDMHTYTVVEAPHPVSAIYMQTGSEAQEGPDATIHVNPATKPEQGNKAGDTADSKVQSAAYAASVAEAETVTTTYLVA